MTQAKKGDKVKVHYTGKMDDGTVFDSSQDRDPLEFVIGEGKVITPIESNIVGMKPKEKKSVKLNPDDAYGEYRDDLVIVVDRSKFPTELKLEVGQQLQVPQPDNKFAIVTVLSASDKEVKIDANHPLAGKNLTFDLELLEIIG